MSLVLDLNLVTFQYLDAEMWKRKVEAEAVAAVLFLWKRKLENPTTSA